MLAYIACMDEIKKKRTYTRKRRKTMNNQAIIECLLDMWLSQKQLKKIKTDWKAFYNDPVKYKDTIVIEMVKQSITE